MLMEPLVNTATSLVVRSDGRVAGLVARQYGKLGAEVTFLIDPQQTARGILVNGRSQRDVPEDMYSDRNRQLTLYQQDDTAYLIIDGDAQEEAMAATSATPFLKRPATWVSDTVAELEGEI
jgi:3-oxo-5alpha-steroid 4-dehydrogenase